MLNVTLLYKTVSKYPEKPCNTEFCRTSNTFTSYRELSMTLAESITMMKYHAIMVSGQTSSIYSPLFGWLNLNKDCGFPMSYLF